MEFIQQVKVAKGISFSFLEFSSDVSLGELGEYSDMFMNRLSDFGL